MWTKPRPGFYKLNLDAAFHDDGTGAVGVVLRNYSGEAIAGTAGPIYHVMDATSAEALAMLKGMELLERLGCSGVVVESDCLQLINACTGDTELFGPSQLHWRKSLLKPKRLTVSHFSTARGMQI